MIIDELVARIGIDFTGAQSAANAVKSLNSFKAAALGVGGVIAGLSAAVTGIALSVAETVDQYADFGNAVGASVETIQTLTAAAEQSGGSFEDVQRGLKTLTDQAGAAAKGNATSQESFARLGVSVQGANGHIKTADQLIEDVADGLSKLKDPASQVNAAIDVLGKGAIKLLPALTAGRAGMQGFRAEMERIGVVMSETSNKRFQKLGDSIDMLKLRATGAKNILAQAFLPFAENTVAKLTQFLENSAGGLFEFGQRFASVVTAPFELFMTIIRALPSELVGVIAAGAALTAVFTLPAVAVLALAVLIAAISEDINAFLKGQPSLLGDVVNGWQNFLGALRDVDDTAKGIEAVFSRIVRILGDVAGFTFGEGINRKRAFRDFQDATGITGVSNFFDRDGGGVGGSIGAFGNSARGLLTSDIASNAQLRADSLIAQPRSQPFSFAKASGITLNAPVTINAANLSESELRAAIEDGLLGVAVQLTSVSGGGN